MAARAHEPSHRKRRATQAVEPLVTLRRGFHKGTTVRTRILEHRNVECFFARKVVVNGGLDNSGSFGNVAYRNAVKAAQSK